jgi:predicted MFS family arabinose efflux permease
LLNVKSAIADRYRAPILASTASPRADLGSRVDLVLLGFGVAVLVGIRITEMLVDRMLRRLVILSLAGFAIVALVFVFAGTSRLPSSVRSSFGAWHSVPLLRSCKPRPAMHPATASISPTPR